MIIENISVLLIILLMGVVFLRAKRVDFAIAIMPLAFVPFVHVLFSILPQKIFSTINLEYKDVFFIADAAALVLTCVFLVFSSASFKSIKKRRFFLILCLVFIFIFTLRLLYYILNI